MATDKRDRQRANRDVKKAEQAKADKRKQLFARIKKYSLYALIFVASIVILRIVAG